MNTYNNLIFIKNEDKTKSIERIQYVKGQYEVQFFSNPTCYKYHYDHVRWLSKPEVLNLANIHLYANGSRLYKVKYAVFFHEGFYRVFYENQYEQLFSSSELELRISCLADQKSGDLLAYFAALAQSRYQKSDESTALLARQYEKLDFVDQKSALATYFDSSKFPLREERAGTLLFPFGCNLSQKAAVKSAMAYSFCLVEGPPGTGKTQTILNMISNILAKGKTVAVVSNNNTATRNVLDKLKKYELDYLAAYLGNSDNKKEFIRSQTDRPFQSSNLSEKQAEQLNNEINLLNTQLDKMLQMKNMAAKEKQDISEFEIQKQYFDDYFQETFDEREQYKLKKKMSSKRLMELWIKYEDEAQNGKTKLSFWQWLLSFFVYGFGKNEWLKLPFYKIVPVLQKEYYKNKLEEMKAAYFQHLKELEAFDFDEKLRMLQEKSMHLLKYSLESKYQGKRRPTFCEEDLRKKSREVLDEYPVIFSTTHSLRSSLGWDILYDYVIVDEASQVDLVTGMLVMSAARNIVVVGDRMQLPNVITEKDKTTAEEIAKNYQVPNSMRYEKHSLLTSVDARLNNIPKTMLREHYRCHPKIIQFCNQKFYKNQLIIMTHDLGEKDVIKVHKTVSGNHARGHINQRQIDEIKHVVLPEISENTDAANVGIIAPYKDQTSQLSKELTNACIEIDTVHKFQGREKDTIIISTVDNQITEFSDRANLVNVAITRAQNKIRLVTSDQKFDERTNIGDFIRYISYNNFEIMEGKVYSVFDLLYKEYALQRESFLKNSKRVSEFNSENIMYKMINEILLTPHFSDLDVITHQPMCMLIKDLCLLDEAEIAYCMNLATHLDFVIYRKVDKSPVLVVEVDGYAFHKAGTRQHERDQMKDAILKKYELPLLRLATNGSREKETIIERLDLILGINQVECKAVVEDEQ